MRIFIILVFFPFLSFAQTNYQKGLVVTNKGDTLKGFINYKDLTPISISFKFFKKDAVSREITIKNTSYLKINGIGEFKRHALSLCSNNIDLPKRNIDTVFLKVLQKGKYVNLLSYDDHAKLRYYTLDKANDQLVCLSELSHKTYYEVDRPDEIHINTTAKEQIIVFAKKYNAGLTDVNRLLNFESYKETGLKNIINMLNGQTYKDIQDGIKPEIRYFAGIGINYGTVKYVGDKTKDNMSNATSNAKYLPTVNLGFDLFLNPQKGKMILRTELSFSTSKPEVTSLPRPENITRSHSFTQYTSSISPHLLINIYNKKLFKFYLAGGFGLNYSKYDKNITTVVIYSPQSKSSIINEYKDTPDLIPLWFNAPVKTGLVLSNKAELFFSYLVPMTKITRNSYVLNTPSTRIGLNYFFYKRSKTIN